MRIFLVFSLWFYFCFNTLIAQTDQSTQDYQQIEKFLIDPLKIIDGTNLTIMPGEEIDIYTGALKLKAVDFSTSIAPGLNLEINRVYNSYLYNYGWNIGTTYLLENNKNLSELVVVYDNGTSEILLPSLNHKNQWISRQGSIFDKEKSILVNNKGFKYFFNNYQNNNGELKYFLNKLETPDGKHWLRYHYKKDHLVKITSSDYNKVIDINLSIVGAILEPTSISFNNQKIINYEYKYYNKNSLTASYEQAALSKITKANGENISYNYRYYFFNNEETVQKQSSDADGRLLLSNVYYPNGESYDYIFNEDLNEKNIKTFKSYRLKSIKHNTNNKFNQYETSHTWHILPKNEEFYNGIKSKEIIVKGPYYSTATVFRNSEYDSLFGHSIPLEYNIYKSHEVSTYNNLQKIIYIWDDNIEPLLKSKTILRYYNNGQDEYKIKLLNYDAYNNPHKIVLTASDGGTKEITQNFYNNIDKNILGLRENLSIDGHEILRQNYDSYGNLTSSKLFGKTNQYFYNKGFIYAKTDDLNNTIYYKNYSSKIPQLVENPDGTKSTKAINIDGTVASVTNAQGYSTFYEYDSNQKLIKVTPPLGASLKYTFNHNDYDKYITLDTYKVNEEYNHAGFLISKTENNRKKIDIQYDGMGRKIFESYPYFIDTDPAAGSYGKYYQYDSLDRVLSECAPSPWINCINYYYTANNTVRVEKPAGSYELTVHQAFGAPSYNNPILIEQAHNTTIFDRDYLGAVVRVTQKDLTTSDDGVVKTYEYDNNHNLIKYKDPQVGMIEYVYDKVGNVIKKTINYTNKIFYNYDSRNYNLLSIIYSDFSHNEYFNYDVNGNITRANKGNITKTYEYDALDRIVHEHVSIYNKYATKLDLYYKYNSKGDLSAIIYPDGMAINFMPNEYGQPTRLGNHIWNIQYHANGYWRNFMFNNGILAGTELDELNRIREYKYGTIVLKYGYDGNNNLSNAQLRDDNNIAYNYNLNFDYDLSGRLIKSRGPWGINQYNYDSYSNILNVKSFDSNSKTINEINYGYDSKLHLTSINNNYISYDSFGNINKFKKNSYNYGLDNNLLHVNGEQVSIYEYDTSHNRIVRHNNNILYSTEIITFYNKDGLAMYEYNINYKRAVKYLYLNRSKFVKIEEYLPDENFANNNQDPFRKPKTSYYYNDINDSVVAMADADGKILWHQLYEPFGRPYLPRVNRKYNKHWFLGKELDNTGLIYLGNCYYNDDLARLMSPVPIELISENSLTFNRYIAGLCA